jgi:uncharacterized protein (DUF58 family)
MQFTRIKPRPGKPAAHAGVYASLDELIRLQFKAQGFSFLPRQPLHSVLYGRHASRLRGRGLNFEELRQYLPGDDIRALDWRVMARTGKPHVRVYSEERDRSVWLLIDQRITMFFGSRARMKSVTAAEAAALAAWRVLAVGDRVGALVFDDADIREIRPQRSRSQVMRILATLLEKNHALSAGSGITAGPGMLDQALNRVSAHARHDALICVISDGSGAGSETRRLVTSLSEHNDVIIALVYDELERELPVSGRLLVSDGHGQLDFDSSGRRLQEDFRADFERRLQTLQALSRRHAIPLLALNGSDPLPEQIRAALGYQPRARRV